MRGEIASSEEIPRPPLVVRAGCIGALRLDASRQAALARTMTAIGGAFDREMSDVLNQCELADFFDPSQRPTLRLVSSLAAGADQLMVETAMQEGEQKQFACDLHAVLPFTAEVFRDQSIASSLADAVESSRACQRFDELLSRAEQTVELDGVYAEGDAGKAARHRAYRAAAWFVLQQSDVMIAAFGRDVEGSAGGTFETVKACLRAQVPVVWLDLAAEADAEGLLPVRVLLRPRDLEQPTATIDSVDGWRKLVRGLVCLPGDGEGGEPIDDQARHAMRGFYGGKVPRVTYRNRLWKLFMKAVGGGSSKPAPALPVEPYETYRRRAAALSGNYTNRYRGAFLINFLLLALLVVVVSGFELLGDSGRTPVWLALLKFAMILFIYWNAFFANSRRWHRQGMDFRLMAELLRSSNYLAPLGVASPRSRLPVHYSLNELRHSWALWLFRSIVRAEPIVATKDDEPERAVLAGVSLDAARDGITDYWLHGQIVHHRVTASTMGRVFDRLEGVAKWLIRLMLIAVLAQAALEIIREVKGLETGGGTWQLLVFIGAVAPAVVASCAGIVYQSEARRLSDRSLAMATQLEEWRKNLHHAAPNPHGCDSWLLARDALSIAQVIADEVADWHMLNQPHEVAAV